MYKQELLKLKQELEVFLNKYENFKKSFRAVNEKNLKALQELEEDLVNIRYDADREFISEDEKDMEDYLDEALVYFGIAIKILKYELNPRTAWFKDSEETIYHIEENAFDFIDDYVKNALYIIEDILENELEEVVENEG